MTLPILYSFRRCPYAMRARLSLKHCNTRYEHREILLKDKPTAMLAASSKGTVPVLVLPDGCVIDESIDIMHWAMNDNAGRDLKRVGQWLEDEAMSTEERSALIAQNDGEFKDQLDKYKYFDRHPEHSQYFYLQQALPFLEKLNTLLSHNAYLGGSEFRFADAAILPFVRQFSMVDAKQFTSLDLPFLKPWLAQALESELFLSIMEKFEPWKDPSNKTT